MTAQLSMFHFANELQKKRMGLERRYREGFKVAPGGALPVPAQASLNTLEMIEQAAFAAVTQTVIDQQRTPAHPTTERPADETPTR